MRTIRGARLGCWAISELPNAWAAFSSVTADDRAALARRLWRRLAHIGLGNLVVLVADALVTGDYEPVDAFCFDGTIYIAADAGDPSASLRHEAIHALYDRRSFTEREWRTLSLQACSAWVKHYADKLEDYPVEWLAEEAIAFAFMDFEAQESARSVAERAVQAVRDFVCACKNVCRGSSFDTPRWIFRRIERGEIGRRISEPPLHHCRDHSDQ